MTEVEKQGEQFNREASRSPGDAGDWAKARNDAFWHSITQEEGEILEDRIPARLRRFFRRTAEEHGWVPPQHVPGGLVWLIRLSPEGAIKMERYPEDAPQVKAHYEQFADAMAKALSKKMSSTEIEDFIAKASSLSSSLLHSGISPERRPLGEPPAP